MTNDHPDIATVCSCIDHELRTLAVSLSAGHLSHEAFLKAVLAVEEEHVQKANLTLTATDTLDHWIVFILRNNVTKEVCAAFEFLPETGEFRRAQQLSGY